MISRDEIAEGATAIGVQVSDVQVDALARFANLLVHWNDAVNLVSRRDVSRLVPRHLLDSLSLLRHLVGARVLDVGTGAGLPGLPLAIAAPTLAFTLLDRSERKLKFARQAVIELALENVETACCPIDDYRPEAAFDTVVVRAVGTPRRLWQSLARVLAPTGVALFQTARPDGLELPAAVSATRHRVDVPGLDEPHWVIVLERETVLAREAASRR